MRGLNARAFSLKTCQRARFLNARSGEDTIEFETREVPAKGDRLLWRDSSIWREHAVVRTDEPLEGLCSVYAESSLCELMDDFVEEQHLVSRTAAQAMAVVLAPTRWSLAEATQPKVSYEVDVAALDGGEAGLGDTVAVIDTSRTPEWRLKARVVRRMRTFGDAVICRVTIRTVQPVDYATASTLAADVAAPQDDVAGIDGNLSVATSTTYVDETVTEAIDELDDLEGMEF